MPEEIKPSLYGIKNSNRNFEDKFCWGKNQFNSSFPVALCCYMRDKDYGSVLISQDGAKTKVSEAGFDYIFGTTLRNDKLKFCFEASFDPYGDFVEDQMEVIDLVIRNNSTGKFIRPLEIKLTTLPDDATSDLPEDRYGSEIVVRSPTMRYMALGLAQTCSAADRRKIKKIFHDACRDVRDWENKAEMLSKREAIFEAVDEFLLKFEDRQKPMLLQPVWKTVGKSPTLADNCLDVFAWTDVALARFIYDIAVKAMKNPSKITRQQRSLLRFARFMYEFAKSGKVFQAPIYDGMTFDTLNDKEFAIGGAQTNRRMKCARLVRPKVRKDEIKNIVLGGGQKYLSPERRFDAILYFSTDLFDED